MISNSNIFFFVHDTIIDNNNGHNKEEIFTEENTRNFSISTNATFENDISLDEEINFNQDFFPQNKLIKFTDFLVDNWEIKIKIYLSNLYQQMIKMQKNNIKIINLNV